MGRKESKLPYNSRFIVQDYYNTLRDTLLQIRQKALQLTQKDFAAKAGISQGSLSLIESGACQPSFRHTHRIYQVAAGHYPIQKIDPKKIGGNIEEIRIEKDLKKNIVAANAGISEYKLDRIEKKRVTASMDEIHAISRALGVKIEHLVWFKIDGFPIEDILPKLDDELPVFIGDTNPEVVLVSQEEYLKRYRAENKKE